MLSSGSAHRLLIVGPVPPAVILRCLPLGPCWFFHLTTQALVLWLQSPFRTFRWSLRAAVRLWSSDSSFLSSLVGVSPTGSTLPSGRMPFSHRQAVFSQRCSLGPYDVGTLLLPSGLGPLIAVSWALSSVPVAVIRPCSSGGSSSGTYRCWSLTHWFDSLYVLVANGCPLFIVRLWPSDNFPFSFSAL